MTINADTRIAAILRQNPQALEVLVSISPAFQKLRNPLLRKLLAGRTSLQAASKLGGCTEEDFFQKLKPLGFEIDRVTKTIDKGEKPPPPFMNSLAKEQLLQLDVRPLIAAGSDPLNLILEKIRSVQPGQVLKIVNSFEPAPLISMLEKKSFESYVDVVNSNLVETYFYKAVKSGDAAPQTRKQAAGDWEQVLQRFAGKLQKTDVRHLEMPQPMLVILEALDGLPADTALYVYHKRIPVFLLTELAQRNFEYRIKEIGDGDVQLLIFRDEGD